MGESESLRVERELHELLRDVELVSESDPPVELLNEAEEICRTRFTAGGYERLAERFPACLVSYIAIRGAERCTGIEVWPQLGVKTQSHRAGRSFLQALRRLGLPDFQELVRDDNARRYVTPILIHGGIPADRIGDLIERLEVELERGLTDGAEAARRLVANPVGLGRPVERLVRYAPQFASELLDALIDRIIGSDGGSARGMRPLPRHLLEALDSGARGRRQRLRRKRLPQVEFDTEASCGPEVVAPEDGEDWVVDQDGRTVALAAGESVEATPCDRLVVTGGGHRRFLWTHPVVWFADGIVVPADRELPRFVTAIVPPGWAVRTDAGVPPNRDSDPVPLSGVWSGHHAYAFDLLGVSEVEAAPKASGTGTGAGRLRRPVAADREPVLEGAVVVEDVVAAGGAAVHRVMPTLRLPAAGRTAHVSFTPVSGHTVSRRFRADDVATTAIDLRNWLGDGPVLGALAVSGAEGRRRSIQLAVVPGLVVSGLARPLAPEATGTARLTAAVGVLTSDAVPVPPLVDRVACPVSGLPHGSIVIEVPRVRWTLRVGRPDRLDLAPGVIEADVEEILDDEPVLLVRCGRAATVELVLAAGGDDLQTRSQAGGRFGQCAFPLAVYGDTLRRHRQSPIEFRLVVDGVTMPAIRCAGAPREGVAPAAEARRWSRRMHSPPKRSVADPWHSVEWLHDVERAPTAVGVARHGEANGNGNGGDKARARPLRLHDVLDPLDPADQLVAFVRELGRASREWRFAPAAADLRTASVEAVDERRGRRGWLAFEEHADRLWRLQGVRYRQFAGKRGDEGLEAWARRAAQAVRRLDRRGREAVELWTYGRTPPVERIVDPNARTWVDLCRSTLPRRPSGIDVFPTALLYQMLLVAGGDEAAGAAVAAAAWLAPNVLLELVAWLLDVTRGRRLHPVTLTDDDGPLGQSSQTVPERRSGTPMTSQSIAEDPPLTSLEGCDIALDGRCLRIAVSGRSRLDAVRLWSDGPVPHAVAVLGVRPNGDSGDVVLDLPDVGTGPHVVTAVDPTDVPLGPPTAPSGHRIDLARPAARGQVSSGTIVRGDDLGRLARLRSRSLVERLACEVEAREFDPALVEELFEDETVAAQALYDHAGGIADGTRLDRLGIAVLPTATLFSTLPTVARTPWLQSHAPVLWAALGPRDATAWRRLGWPNGTRFHSRAKRYDDVVGFARKRLALCTDVGLDRVRTVRYRLDRSTVTDDRARATVRRLRHTLDDTFVDLVVMAYCAMTVEAVMPEATRLLIQAHHANASAVAGAVLVGAAFAFATAGR